MNGAVIKILSGKFLFTLVTACVFAYATYAKVLNGEQIYGVIMLVVAAYFGRVTTAPTNGNGENK